jgi:YaiO family outer membrane protein
VTLRDARLFPTLVVLALVSARPGAVLADTPSVEELIARGDHAAARLELSERLRASPEDAEARFSRARVSGFLGDYEAALADYDRLVERDPANVDYVFGRAQALAWLARDQLALAELERAILLAPDYEAVWRLKFAILARLPDTGTAERVEALRHEAARRFPDSGWWQEPAPAPTRAWTLVAGGAVEDLSNGLPGWNNQFVELQWRQSDAVSYNARFARANRFDVVDTQLGIGAEFRLDERWFAGISVAGGADADFAAARSFAAHLGRQLEAGWVADLRISHREFETATVSSYAIATEKYFGDYRAAYTLSLTHLHGATDSVGHVASLTWYASERNAFGVSLAAGEEAEAIAPGQVLETDVSGVSLTGRHRINDRISISWWAGTHEQGDFYRRDFIGLAASVGF